MDLYGGTRHLSARALRHFHTPEQIRKATMHTTNKAFERYFRIETDDLREIYASTRLGQRKKREMDKAGDSGNGETDKAGRADKTDKADKKPITKNRLSEKVKYLNFEKKNGGGGGSRTHVRRHST